MPRSVKKGPFVEHYLPKKIQAAQKESNPNKRVVTTYSRREVGCASVPGQCPPYRLEGTAAGAMTVAVVDVLETVHVGKE